jgi:hypothetical protein
MGNSHTNLQHTYRRPPRMAPVGVRLRHQTRREVERLAMERGVPVGVLLRQTIERLVEQATQIASEATR